MAARKFFVLTAGLALLFFNLSLTSTPGDTPAGMVLVRGGAFMMGIDGELTDEKPIHEVSTDSFYIDKYEVTQEEWQEIMGSNPSFFKGEKNPVGEIDWYTAIEFCNKKSKVEGLTPCYSGIGDNINCNFAADGYRLPTEAEWEFACLGGLKSRNYSFSGSNDISEVAWYEGNSGGKPHPVGQKKPNELGIYDMSGNNWEWCWDWYAQEYNIEPSHNPTGPASGKDRCYRGGGINGRMEFERCKGRFQISPSYSHSDMGLRLVKKASGRIPEGMVLVKGGKYKMGSNAGGYGFGPAHKVTVQSFYMTKFEISQEEWVKIMGVNNCWFSGAECAVDGVRWYEAVEYCNERSKKEGLTPCYSGSGDQIACDFKANGYRLPTEAEWEYAARGGAKSQHYKFSGSNDAGEVAWSKQNVNNGRTGGTGLKKANELGIYDMTGNVREWCWDRYEKFYYEDSPALNPQGSAAGIRRVVRSSSITDNPLPVHFRLSMKPINGYLGVGLRVVRTAE
jgi:formylglycine-generating enzyme required for sulfatase activity